MIKLVKAYPFKLLQIPESYYVKTKLNSTWLMKKVSLLSKHRQTVSALNQIEPNFREKLLILHWKLLARQCVSFFVLWMNKNNNVMMVATKLKL